MDEQYKKEFIASSADEQLWWQVDGKISIFYDKMALLASGNGQLGHKSVS